MIKLLQFPWSFSNLVEVDAQIEVKLLKSHIIFPCNELVNVKNLEKLSITDAKYYYVTEEVFEVAEGTNEDVDIGTQSIVVSIGKCHLLGHVFTSCMVGSLLQLQELQISNCKNMDVIVKQVEDSEITPTEVVFPCLKTITLHRLPNLIGFCMGKVAFE
ncbi:unnamed protein product [Lactuca virosa]|uniref:Disease resistance protein At4g27190-like leucine-rich repeats domain-containing protein n=1 Tax=Lactuca virosa TaxID=75947 RepID=A0AAU9MRZ1_9ASTR|nr:unnamed protein product [Lactuca virosa]